LDGGSNVPLKVEPIIVTALEVSVDQMIAASGLMWRLVAGYGYHEWCGGTIGRAVFVEPDVR